MLKTGPQGQVPIAASQKEPCASELPISSNPIGPKRTKIACRESIPHERARNRSMLWTLFVVLLVLWVIGIVSSYTLGGFIHILLVLAVIALAFQLLSGRRPVV